MIGPRSLRWRLQIWHGMLLVAVLAAFGVATAELDRSRRLGRIDAELQERVAVLARSLRPEGGGSGGSPLAGEKAAGRRFHDGPANPPPPARDDDPDFGPEDSPPPAHGAPALRLSAEERARFGPESGGYYYAIWRKNGSPLRSANAPADVPRPQGVTGWRNRGDIRELIGPLGPGDYVLAGRSLAAEWADWRRVNWLTAGAGAGVLAVGLLGGAWLTRRALRPIGAIGEAAEEIAAGNLARRIAVGDPASELGRLAEVLNATFARLETAFAQQAQFTADAAHELRTPVSVLLMQAQNGLDAADLSPEAKVALAACQRAAQRMRRLIESLLELAKWDAGEATLRRTACDLAAVAEAEIELLRGLADARRVRLVAQLAPAECSGDPDRLGQVVGNLLLNAIQHSAAGGVVQVRTEAAGAGAGQVSLEINDDGAGILAEHLPHIFDRFYRADTSRTEGRSGLGLSISRAIVEAHEGKIEATNRPGGGARFQVTLPTA